MRIGLLWYDADPKKPAQTKIDEAVARYRERFGAVPNTCHVSPQQPTVHPYLHIVANPWVRPHMFWLGEDEDIAIHRASSGRTKAAVGARRTA